ncbi:MAG: insulinase family protein [Bacteroidales bacterium]
MNRLIILIVLSTLILSSCQTEKYKVSEKKDGNGYSFITVSNDPFKARVYTLDNGLTLFLSKNTDQPRISALIGVKAGSAYEDPDATGLAHYLEHMMFKGTSKIGAMNWEAEEALLDQISDLFEEYRNTNDPSEKKEVYRKIDSLSYIAAGHVATNELDKIYTALGDNMLNAGTSYESTIYMCEIPKNEIEKWAKIESERFSDVVLRLFHTELETVYEEFNMYQDMDGTRANDMLMQMLFPEHPYGRNIIGLPEHLKNPSMVEINRFIDNYYVPNNMAISLSGDFEFEPVAKLVNEYFGKVEKSQVMKPERPVETPLTQIQKGEVTGPEEEFVSIAWRISGSGSSDEPVATVISSLLFNRQAGLMDINLNQAQKVKNSSASAFFLKDYGIFALDGYPRQGQKLEEVEELILSQLELIKTGDFEDWMLEAIINNAKLNYMRSLERSFSRAYMMINSFIYETPFEEYVSFIDRLGTVTREEVIEFADEILTGNYAVVYKKAGENTGLVKVEKPEITPVNINRDLESEFASQLLAEKSPPIDPVFVDFEEALAKENIREGLDLYYAQNEINGLFSLTYLAEVGKDHNIRLPVAFGYGSLLGTSDMEAEELKKELYRYGLSLSMSSGERMSTITISGLDENLPKAVEILEKVLTDIQPDQQVLDAYIGKLLKEREDNKKNLYAIRSAVENYSLFGSDSPILFQIPESELKELKAEELTDLIKGITGYPLMISYYGPSNRQDVQNLIAENHKMPAELKAVPDRITRKSIINTKPIVYVVDFDISQANISITSNCETLNADLIPEIQVFNNYFSPIVFQEIREAKGLAYTATASVQLPAYSDQMIRYRAFMSTQADKLGIALDGMTELMNRLPGDEKSFRLACEGLINSIATQRITNRGLFNTWYSYKLQGIDNDIREKTYLRASEITLPEMEQFFNDFITERNYSYLVVGNRNMLDFRVLNQIGQVKELSLNEIFGY